MSDIEYNLMQIRILNENLELKIHNSITGAILKLQKKALEESDYDTLEKLLQLRGDLDCT